VFCCTRPIVKGFAERRTDLFSHRLPDSNRMPRCSSPCAHARGSAARSGINNYPDSQPSLSHEPMPPHASRGDPAARPRARRPQRAHLRVCGPGRRHDQRRLGRARGNGGGAQLDRPRGAQAGAGSASWAGGRYRDRSVVASADCFGRPCRSNEFFVARFSVSTQSISI
jgi:hypothetical protein